MSERKKQKPEEKVKIVKRYLAGEVSMSEAVTEAGVNWKTLQKWVMQYEAEGAAAFLPGRREHIQSGIKAAGRAQQKIWITGQKAAPKLAEGV